MNAHVTDRMF